MQSNEKIASALNDLLTRNYDAERGYTEAGNQVTDGRLREWLFENAERRKRFGKEIKKMIASLGQEPDKGTSFLGDVHRVWIDFKTSMTSDVNEATLEECIRGEKRALEDYDKVLNEVEMTVSIAEAIRSQRNEIKTALKNVEILEESYDSVK